MNRQEPTRQQLLTGWWTTTLFESIGLTIGAVLFALSGALALPVLGLFGIATWFLALWAENYSVAELVVPRFNFSKPLSILVMSIAEFATWTIWLFIVLQTNIPALLGGLLLFILTHIHHTIQFCFFFPDAQFMNGFRSPLLLLASAIEAVVGQWLIIQVIHTDTQQLNFGTLILPLIGIFILFGVEHLVGGQVKPN